MRRLIPLVAAVVALAGLLILREAGSSPAPAQSSEPIPPSTESTPAPERLDEARSAAIRAVASTGEVVRAGMFSRGDVIGRFATPEFAGSLTSDTTSQVNEFLLDLGESGVDTSELAVVEAPVVASAEDIAAGQVRVEVWSVLVVSVPGRSTPTQAWRTTVLDMVLVDGRWLVDGWESTPGPSPVPSPHGPIGPQAEIEERLGWVPAVGGV